MEYKVNNVKYKNYENSLFGIIRNTFTNSAFQNILLWNVLLKINSKKRDSYKIKVRTI